MLTMVIKVHCELEDNPCRADIVKPKHNRNKIEDNHITSDTRRYRYNSLLRTYKRGTKNKK